MAKKTSIFRSLESRIEGIRPEHPAISYALLLPFKLVRKTGQGMDYTAKKIGPKNCFFGGLILTGISVYFRYYKSGAEAFQGNYFQAVGKFLLYTPVGITSDFLMAAGGIDEGKRLIKSYKKSRRAKRLYNAWKTPKYFKQNAEDLAL